MELKYDFLVSSHNNFKIISNRNYEILANKQCVFQFINILYFIESEGGGGPGFQPKICLKQNIERATDPKGEVLVGQVWETTYPPALSWKHVAY